MSYGRTVEEIRSNKAFPVETVVIGGKAGDEKPKTKKPRVEKPKADK